MKNPTLFQVWVTLESEDIVNEESSQVTSIMVLSDEFHETLKSLILHVSHQLTAFFLAGYLVSVLND